MGAQDPHVPAGPAPTAEVRPTAEYLAAKYDVSVEQARAMDQRAAAQAKSDGLAYVLDRPFSSTFDMLRLVQLGNRYGVGWEYMSAMQAELFGGNPDAFDHATLIRLSKELGLPTGRAARSAGDCRNSSAARGRRPRRTSRPLAGTAFPRITLAFYNPLRLQQFLH